MSIDRDALAPLLGRGVEGLGVAVDAAAQEKLLDYVALLDKWNRAFNLTAVRDPAEMVVKHLLDSLAVLPHLVGQRLIDVGSGPGIPGIVLAIARPDLHFTELDSNGKKTRFMSQAVRELALPNVEVVQGRVEAFRPEAAFDAVLSRAFASIADMVAGAGPLCAEGGALLAMKGQYPAEELAALPAGWRVDGVERLEVPGLGAERCLVRLVRG